MVTDELFWEGIPQILVKSRDQWSSIVLSVKQLPTEDKWK